MFARWRLRGHSCRVADTDFYVDVVVTGAVLGVGVTESPDAVASVLGDDFVADQDRGRLRLDYGLVEFFWERRSGSDPWQAAGFTVQVHRLSSNVEIAAEVVDRYGPFTRRLAFARLNAELDRLGYHLDETTRESGADYRSYWLAESRTIVNVAATGWGERLEAGDVWSIGAPYPAESIVVREWGAHRQAIKDGLAHLLRLGDDQREEWLERRQPPPDRRVNWWLYLLLVVDQQLGLQPGRRMDWVQLKLWLLRQAAARQVFTAAESAEKMACFVLGLRRAGVEAPAVLPSADDLVRACLAAIPVGLDQVALLDDRRDLHRLDRAQLRHSRQAKNLINAADGYLHEVEDERLAEQLRGWIAVKQRLV